MARMTFSRLAELTGGRVVAGGDAEFDSVVIDGREAKEGSLFFAIVGERLDGHDYVSQALEKGRGAVVSRLPDPLPEGKGVVLVPDTSEALRFLARGVRQSMSFVLIGITGSAGKTTTKEMIATLIATEKRTWRSWGNFNNQIGFPLCMANAPDDAEVVVSEMGMSSKGEIEALARLSYPDVGVYTNIQPVHLEFFGSIDGIAAAKRELLENLAPDGLVVINADDGKVMEISRGFEGPKVLYGLSPDAAYRAEDVEMKGLLGSRFTLAAEGDHRPIDLALPGIHNLENLLAAIATARSIGISWKGVERGIAALAPAKHRGVVVEYRGATLYDDTYNSNPYALGRTLELLAEAEAPGRKIAVIGDMLELGPEEETFHFEAGRGIPPEVHFVIGVGPRAKHVLAGARDGGFDEARLFHFDQQDSAGEFLRGLIEPGDLVLLKGSRGVGLDRIVTRLEGEV
jgi:UDP-N-acetylmuramoyl-tripeptide--D-alanyl-D-alanine ligase